MSCGCSSLGGGGGDREGAVASALPPCWPGAEGEVVLEYVGDDERIIRLGVVTGIVYVFEADSRIKQVDIWDMPRLVGDAQIRRYDDRDS